MDIRKLAGVEIDEYKLVTLLGEGGMSAVYRAYQEELDRYVAMKLLSDKLLDDNTYVERFNQEAKTAAALEHQHIVPIYDFGIYEQTSYVVMRLLSQTLEERLVVSKPFTLNAALQMLRGIAKSLDYAHSRGVIHRDIKLSNIMFDDTGTAYLVDFGIAKIMQQDSNLTTENIVLGTPSYMSPEQWRDDPLTSAVDQYALAVVMFCTLAGQMPYQADNSSALMYKHLNADIPDVREFNDKLPAQTASVLSRGLAKDARDRYPNVGAFAEALRDSLLSIGADVTQQYMPVVDIPEPPPQADVTQEAAQVASQPTQQNTPAPRMQPPRTQAPPPTQPPRTQPPRRPVPQKTGQQSVLVQIAKGGIIGVGVLFAIIIIALIIILALFAPEQPEPSKGFPETNNAEGVEVISEPTDIQTNPTAEIAITSRAPLNTPQVVGVTAADIEQIDTVIGINPIPVRDVSYSPDGSMFAVADGEGKVKLWRNGTSGGAVELIGHTDVASALDFSPDGTILASAGRDNTIILWDVNTGTEIRRITGHTNAVRDIDFNPDGTLLASASEDGTVQIWNMTTNSTQQIIQADGARVLTVEFHPVRNVVASGGRNGRVRLWRVDNGSLVRDLVGHADEEIRDISFNSDGSLIASASTDDNIILWNFDSGERLQTMSDHGRDVFVVTFSPDDSLLASGGRDNNLRVFDVASGNQLKLLTGNQGWVLGVDFAPDGTTILTGGGDGSVRLYGVR